MLGSYRESTLTQNSKSSVQAVSLRLHLSQQHHNQKQDAQLIINDLNPEVENKIAQYKYQNL